jgi:hypothetical protein
MKKIYACILKAIEDLWSGSLPTIIAFAVVIVALLVVIALLVRAAIFFTS